MKEVTEVENKTPSQDPRSSLVQWANAGDEWIRRLLRLTLDSDGEITKEERDLTYQLLLEEKGLKERTLQQVPQISLVGQVPGGPGPLHLKHIANVRGVNALIEGVEIAFAPGLTLLFGENGTGKTGYARILKCLAGSRSADDILPDINQGDDPPTPQAEIGYCFGAAQLSHEWTGEQAHYPFTMMSVFDTPSVRLHLDNDLGYTYRPAALALFDSLTREVQFVRDTIGNELSSLKLSNSDLLGRFDRRSSIYPHVESLSAATDLSELQQFSSLPDDAEEQKSKLEASIAGLTAGTIVQQIALQDRLQKVLTDALGYTDIVKDLKAQDYNITLARLSNLHRDQATLRDNLFAAADLPAAPDQTWEEFVSSGQGYRKYLESLGVHDGSRCLYCRQSLSHEAVQLIGRYSDYLESQIATEIQEQEAVARSLVKSLRGFSLTTVQGYIEGVDRGVYRGLPTPPDRIEVFRRIVDQNAGLQQKLADGLPIDDSVLAEASRTRAVVQSWLSGLKDTLEEMRNQDSDREKSLKEKGSDLIDLKDRIELCRSWAEIEKIVASAKHAQKLQEQRKAVTTILSNITNLSTKASEQLTNRNFEGLFATECKELRTPELKLEFFGREGRARRRRTLPSDHKPSSVFSEGEQKALAVADFIAEVRMSDNSVPVIFDDPVSSLDHRRVQEVANRITDLASDHQVVVFTHDIFFATCLLALFEKSDRCVYYRVTDEDGKGTVERGTGPRWDTNKNLTANINVSIEEAKQAVGEEREAHIRDAYGWIRSWCEVFVERDVLAQVTERYQPNVRMTNLGRINVSLLEETIRTVTSVFEDACRYIEAHSQPFPTLGVAPTLARLQEDWGKLRKCRSRYIKPPG